MIDPAIFFSGGEKLCLSPCWLTPAWLAFDARASSQAVELEFGIIRETLFSLVFLAQTQTVISKSHATCSCEMDKKRNSILPDIFIRDTLLLL